MKLSLRWNFGSISSYNLFPVGMAGWFIDIGKALRYRIDSALKCLFEDLMGYMDLYILKENVNEISNNSEIF